MIAALKEQGYDIDEVRALGEEIKEQIKQAAKDYKEGTGLDNGPKVLEIPRSTGGVEELSSIDLPDVPKRPAGNLPMEERLAKAVNLRVEQLETDLKGIAKQVFGDDLPNFKFNREGVNKVTPKEWGGDGIKLSEQGGSYTTGIQDLVKINNLMNRPMAELRSTMFHESWHRIQVGYLKPKELKVLDNVFGQEDIANWATSSATQSLPANKRIAQTEVQAVAFQNYSAMRDKGETRMDVIRDAMTRQLEEAFPGLKGWQKKFTVKTLTAMAEGWERIRGFAARAQNLISGNGYQNVYDLFEQAFDGELTKGRRFEDATKTIDEVLSMTEAQYNDLVATGNIEEVNTSFDEAVERKVYFSKWKGKANTVLNSIDTEIAALKKLATEGGC